MYVRRVRGLFCVGGLWRLSPKILFASPNVLNVYITNVGLVANYVRNGFYICAMTGEGPPFGEDTLSAIPREVRYRSASKVGIVPRP